MIAALIVLALTVPPQHSPRHREPSNRGVPILMYHIISAPPPGTRYPQLYVRPSDFGRQMAWLASHRYHVVTLGHVYDSWRGDERLPRRAVVISFDDGYLSQYTRALPTLRADGWDGVLNLQVDFLHGRGGLRAWRVRKLIAAGWEIDAHTITHPDLTTVDPVRLWREVDGSRVAIRREFHVPVDFFCYPAGRYNAAVVAAVRRAGFLGATTTTDTLATPRHLFKLGRIEIDDSDGLNGFVRKLRLTP